MLTWVEVRSILRSVLQWWWVIVIAVVLASGSAFVISRKYEEQFYIAHATLMVGTSFKDTKPDPEEVRASAALAQFYAELAHREPVLSPVRDALQLPVPWEYVNAEMMTAKVIEQANLIDITITDSNPERAAAIANAVGEQLQAFSPTSPEKIKAEQDALGEQLNDTYTRIQSLKTQQSELDQQRSKATSASDYTELNTKLDQIELNLQRENDTYKSLITLQRSSIINTVSFVERATPPTSALPSKRKIIVASAGLAGFMLSLLAIFVLEKLDTRWSSRRDVEDRFRLRDLGTVPELNELVGDSPRRELAYEIETQRMEAPIGKQDQYGAAFGGLNCIEFSADGVKVTPLAMSMQTVRSLEQRLMLFFTGSTRQARDILQEQRSASEQSGGKTVEALHRIKELGWKIKATLEEGRLDDFGALLDEAWQQKKRLASNISNQFIDDAYSAARHAGAIGGKITGAGGGGFLMLYCPEEHQNDVRSALKKLGLQQMRCAFEFEGTRVLLHSSMLNSPIDWSH